MMTTSENYEAATEDGTVLQADTDRQIAEGRTVIVLRPGDYKMRAPLRISGATTGLYVRSDGVTLRFPADFLEEDHR